MPTHAGGCECTHVPGMHPPDGASVTLCVGTGHSGFPIPGHSGTGNFDFIEGCWEKRVRLHEPTLRSSNSHLPSHLATTLSKGSPMRSSCRSFELRAIGDGCSSSRLQFVSFLADIRVRRRRRRKLKIPTAIHDDMTSSERLDVLVSFMANYTLQ